MKFIIYCNCGSYKDFLTLHPDFVVHPLLYAGAEVVHYQEKEKGRESRRGGGIESERDCVKRRKKENESENKDRGRHPKIPLLHTALHHHPLPPVRPLQPHPLLKDRWRVWSLQMQRKTDQGKLMNRKKISNPKGTRNICLLPLLKTPVSFPTNRIRRALIPVNSLSVLDHQWSTSHKAGIHLGTD